MRSSRTRSHTAHTHAHTHTQPQSQPRRAITVSSWERVCRDVPGRTSAVVARPHGSLSARAPPASLSRTGTRGLCGRHPSRMGRGHPCRPSVPQDASHVPHGRSTIFPALQPIARRETRVARLFFLGLFVFFFSDATRADARATRRDRVGLARFGGAGAGTGVGTRGIRRGERPPPHEPPPLASRPRVFLGCRSPADAFDARCSMLARCAMAARVGEGEA